MKATIVRFKRDGSAFLASDDEWYSVRGLDLRDKLEEGDTVEFENKKKGRWNNIVDNKVTKVSGGAAAPSGGNAPARGKRWHAYEDREYQNKINRRIGRQNALTNAVTVLGPIDQVSSMDTYLGHVLKVAESFARWTAGQDVADVLEAREQQNPAPTPPPAEDPPTPTEEHAPSAGPELPDPDFDDDLPF